MSYSPGLTDVVPPMVSSFTAGWAATPQELATGVNAASAAWESANLAVYQAILVPVTCVLRRAWWANGATVSASYNVDVGLYADAGFKPGVRLVSSGSTAQGTASEVQLVDVTDTTIGPGLYWIAMACSSASATFFRSQIFGSANSVADMAFRFQQTTALALPSTATPAASSAVNIWLCGFATTASP